MAIRIKSHWLTEKTDREDPQTLKANGDALAFIAWRLAMDKAKTLHGEKFDYETDGQRIAVIAEYLAFMVQIADRLVYEQLSDEARAQLITALGKKLAVHVQDNLPDFFGEADYATPFIATLNQRLADYADFEFQNEQPGYAFLRYFGEKIQQIMGQSQTNRWVINQVMERDGPEVANKFQQALYNLLGLND